MAKGTKGKEDTKIRKNPTEWTIDQKENKLGKNCGTFWTNPERNFDLVHTNICGPFKTKFLRGAKYFITFINDKNMTMEKRTFKNKDQILKHSRNSKTILNQKSRGK